MILYIATPYRRYPVMHFLKKHAEKTVHQSRDSTRSNLFFGTKSNAVSSSPGCCLFLPRSIQYTRPPFAEKPAAPGMLSTGVINSIMVRPRAAPLLRVSAFCPVCAGGESAARTEAEAEAEAVCTSPHSALHHRPHHQHLHRYTGGHYSVCLKKTVPFVDTISRQCCVK